MSEISELRSSLGRNQIGFGFSAFWLATGVCTWITEAQTPTTSGSVIALSLGGLAYTAMKSHSLSQEIVAIQSHPVYEKQEADSNTS